MMIAIRNKHGVAQYKMDASTIASVKPVNATLGVVCDAAGIAQRRFVRLSEWTALQRYVPKGTEDAV